MASRKPQADNGARRYEIRDVNVRSMLWAAAGLAFLILGGMLASWVAFRYFVHVQKLGPPASPFENTRELPPAPQLQVTPAETLKAYRAEENAKLSTYGWVDKHLGVVRIPIERAVELSLNRGFPVRANAGGAEAGAGAGSREAGIVPAAAETEPGRNGGTGNQ